MGKADDDLILLFGDSAEVSLLPTLTRCWTKVGVQRVSLTPGVRAQKRWDWGAVDVVTGRTLHLTHLRRNNVGFRRLLAAIARTFRLKEHPQRKVVLFVDTDQAHHQSKFVIYSPSMMGESGLSGCHLIHQSSIPKKTSGATCAAV